LIRQGELCRRCSDKKCEDEGTDAEPIEIECPACNGTGCDECTNGNWILKGCPNRYCDSIGQFVSMADLFNEGLPPVAGGSLDQSASFVDAVRILKYEENRIKAEVE
jgi:hypothetical protein